VEVAGSEYTFLPHFCFIEEEQSLFLAVRVFQRAIQENKQAAFKIIF
jgi:hypothetical protein